MYDATMTASPVDKTSPLLVQNRPVRMCRGCRNWRWVGGRIQRVELEGLSSYGLCPGCQNKPMLTHSGENWETYAYGM